MATGVEKAADRLQGLHNLHLLVCIVVLVFGVINVLDADRKAQWIDSERTNIEPILRDARRTIAALRPVLYQGYGLPGGKRYSESESGRVEALVSDIYLAREHLRQVARRVVDTLSSTAQGGSRNPVLFDVTSHIEDINTIFRYGLTNDGAIEGALRLANPDLGTIGESRSLGALTIQDLAKLGYAASASPRTIVTNLELVAASPGPLNPQEIKVLADWLEKSKSQFATLKNLRDVSSLLWNGWNDFTTENGQEETGAQSSSSIPTLSPEIDTTRRLKASISTSQSVEEFFRQLRLERSSPGYPEIGERPVKVPGLEIDLRFDHLLLVFPWVVAFLLAFKYTTMHQIRFSAMNVGATDSTRIREMADEAAGTLPLYRWSGPVATKLVVLFVILTEIFSIAVMPALGWWLATRLAGMEGNWFWYGFCISLILWILYVVELLRTRSVLFGSAATMRPTTPAPNGAPS